MITNPITISLLIASLFLTLTRRSIAEEKTEEKLVASVTGIVHAKHSIADTVTLRMTIHAPGRFGGFHFEIVTDSTDRAAIRTEFPAGSLLMLDFPVKIMRELEGQIKAHASVEKTLDAGIDPMMISQAFLVPSVSISELSTKLVTVTMNKQAEQDAAVKNQGESE